MTYHTNRRFWSERYRAAMINAGYWRYERGEDGEFLNKNVADGWDRNVWGDEREGNALSDAETSKIAASLYTK